MDKYKDLKKGNLVRYKNILTLSEGSVSGEGPIYGFGTAGETDIVWVERGKGAIAVPYKEIIKV